MSMKKSIINWLKEGGEIKAAEIFEKCTVKSEYMDYARVISPYGNTRTIELFSAIVGIPRYIITKLNEDSQYKNQIENAIKECFSASGENIDNVSWVPIIINQDNKKDLKDFVNTGRLENLKGIKSQKFDLTRLIRLCEELNICYKNDAYMSCAMITRSILDHVPPIFGQKTFPEVYNNYAGARSFKEAMNNLDKFSRKIADFHLHTHIRQKEVLPNKTQINFSNPLDVLLSEVIRLLKS